MTLEIASLSKRYGAIHAVRDASFTARAGEVLGLLGPNGAGKSTILACLAGLLPADGGTVRVDDHDVPAHARRDVLFHLPDGIRPWPEQRAGWVLDAMSALAGGTPNADAIDALALGTLLGRRMGALSKGQRKRVLLAIALSAPQRVLLMDEPFDGLDLRQTREAIALLRRHAASGRALVLSIHSMTDAARVCDRLALLADGVIVAEGTVAELRERAGVPDAELEEVFLALA